MRNWKGIGIGISPEAFDNTITRPVRRNTVIKDNSDEMMMSTGYRSTNTLRIAGVGEIVRVTQTSKSNHRFQFKTK